MRPLAPLVALGLAACLPVNAPETGAAVLAIGDSVLAFYDASDASIPDVAAAALGARADNRAVSGAMMLGGAAAIPAQLPPGPHDLVIVNGGANDLRGLCGCEGCDDVLAALIGPDGRGGAYPALVDRLRAGGAMVVLLGYYGPNAAGGPFAPCADELDELGRRLALLAAARDGVVFVSAKAVIRPEDRGAYAIDNTHPSRRGAALIGRLVAKAAGAE